MSKLDLKDLLKAGAHFGHQVQKWNPRMKPYVYGQRDGIYIIDLEKTVECAEKAYDFLKQTVASGKSILFVGTKRQASETVKIAAESSKSFFVVHRWLGGMLTNYKTVIQSIEKLRKVDKMKESGDFFLLTKKEQGRVEKEVIKLERNLGGIKNMRKLPGAVVVFDPETERIAVKEAQKLGVPVVALADTNCDPRGIDYIVPANDDAMKSIKLFANFFANAIQEGKGGEPVGDQEQSIQQVSLEQEILDKYEKDIELKGETETPEEETEE